MITVRRQLYALRRAHGRRVLTTVVPPQPPAPGRVPRIARLMALAIHFDRLIREGQVRDQSELARLAHVTQPRMTQLTNLNLLAPDVQEQLLHLPSVKRGRDPLTERDLRVIAAEIDWSKQRGLWRRLQDRIEQVG